MGKKQGWVLTVHRWIRVCFARDMLGGNCLRCWIFGFAALAGALVVLASLSFALTALGSVGVLLQKGLSVWGEGGMDGIQLKETGSQGDRLPTFRELLSSGLLDFRGYSVNSLVGKHFAQYMIDVLTPYVEMPPVFDNPAERCLPPTSYFQANCSANERHWGFFTGERRSRPKKIVDMFMMGYDLDILDVRFFELDHAVDLFVLLEYSQTNYKHRKPYLFEKNKARYSKYLHKILHVVVPDSVLKEDCPPWPTACWEVQVKNRFRIWEHFGEWNRQQREKWEALKGVGGGGVQNNASMSRRELQDGDESVFPMFFEDDDLMLFSDPDEIPAGDVLNLMKQCQPEAAYREFAGFEILSLSGTFREIFTAEEGGSVRGGRYAHPMISTMAFARNYGGYLYFFKPGPEVIDIPTEKRKRLYGGWHMTDHHYLPYELLKFLSYGEYSGRLEWHVYKGALSADFEAALKGGQRTKWRRSGQMVNVNSSWVRGQEAYETKLKAWRRPALLECSAGLPTWEDKEDPRYDRVPDGRAYFNGEPVSPSLLRDNAEALMNHPAELTRRKKALFGSEKSKDLRVEASMGTLVSSSAIWCDWVPPRTWLARLFLGPEC